MDFHGNFCPVYHAQNALWLDVWEGSYTHGSLSTEEALDTVMLLILFNFH